LPPDTSEHTPF